MINKKIVGLDISDYSIEAVEMEQEGVNEKIIAHNRLIIEPGIVERGIIKNKKKLAEAIMQTFATAKPLPIVADQIVFGLPESRIFLHFFSLEIKDEDHLPKKIKNEAINIIPIAEDDMVLAYKEIKNKNKNGSEAKNILIAATSKQVLDDWEKFFNSIKLSLVFFDIESMASFRGLYDELPEKPICLIDLGAETIALSIFSQAGLEYNYQMQYGGKYLSAKLASGLRIDLPQAEIIKKETSLIADGKNIAAKEILQMAFTHVSEEIKRNLLYFSEKNPQYTAIEKIILIGGSSLFNGLSEFLIEKGLKGVTTYQNTDLKYQDLGIEYLEAIGLGRRYLSAYWQNDLVFATEKKNIFKKIPILSFLLNFEILEIINKLTLKKKIIFLAVLFFIPVLLFILLPNKEIKTIKKQDTPVLKTEEKKEIISEIKIPVEVKIIKKIKIQNIGSNLNVRIEPNKTAKIATQVRPESVYAIMDEKPGWYKIEYEKGKFGWVVSEYVNIVSDK